LLGFPVNQTNQVDTLVRDARKRHLLILAGEQFAVCVILVCAGGALMLLAGTQILSWYWLVPLLCGGLVAGWVRFRRRAIPAYGVAQLLDVRLDLRDTISTAWFLRHGVTHPAIDVLPSAQAGRMARTQVAQADAIAATVNPAPAFPVTGQRTWAAAGALFAVVVGLFGIRYLVDRSLDLKKALIPLPQIGNVLASMEKRLLSPGSEPGDHNKLDATGDNQEARAEKPDDPRMNEVLGVKNPNGSDAASSDPNGPQAPKTQKMDAANGDQPPNGENGKQNSGSPDAQQAGNNQPSPMGAPPPGGQPQTGPQNGQQPQSSPGLLDKMKDAMSSLVSKMKPSSSPQSSQNPSKQPNNGEDEDKSPGAQGEQAQSKQQGANNQQAGQEANAQGEENSQTAERAQNAQGRNSDRSSDKNGNDAHSGVGRQDGAKELKEAQQQEAMGKLAEIIGKRSANLTGEVMVEVPNGKQQLQTKYSQKVGKHADLGGEINRDEVPLIYQQYVREYMEQVHKQAKTLK
jgi:hypothetical protein